MADGGPSLNSYRRNPKKYGGERRDERADIAGALRRLDQSFDRREWGKQYQQQWPIECDHAKEVGKIGLGIDIYRKEVRCADCGNLIEWERTCLVLVRRSSANSPSQRPSAPPPLAQWQRVETRPAVAEPSSPRVEGVGASLIVVTVLTLAAITVGPEFLTTQLGLPTLIDGRLMTGLSWQSLWPCRTCRDGDGPNRELSMTEAERPVTKTPTWRTMPR